MPVLDGLGQVGGGDARLSGEVGDGPRELHALGWETQESGERLKAYRWARGLTQEEMARKAGGTLARWERGWGARP